MVELSDIRESLPFEEVGDSREFRALLDNKSLRRALKVVLLEAEAKDRLSACDLRGDEGINEARERKGEVRGLLRGIEILLELGAENGN